MDTLQKLVSRFGVPYLLTDLRNRDLSAYELLQTSPFNPSRRWFYLIRPKGVPIKILHRVEPESLRGLRGITRLYSTRSELIEELRESIGNIDTVMMNYSADIPVLSIIDAGTIDLVRKIAQVTPAAPLLNHLQGTQPVEAFSLQRAASKVVDRIREKAFRSLSSGESNHEVLEDILSAFRRNGLITEGEPVVAFGAQAANPHFDTRKAKQSQAPRNRCVLIDLWAKANKPAGIFFDSTWCGFHGAPPKDYLSVFAAVRDARDAAIEFLFRSAERGRVLLGRDVDLCCRNVLKKSGFEKYVVHRTGHSIGRSIHGLGTNLDSWETNDTREILPLSSFSVEPGLYIPGKFGVRLETTIAVNAKGTPQILGQLQSEPVLF